MTSLAAAPGSPAAPTGRKVWTRTWRRSAEMNSVNMISTRSISPATKRAIRSCVSVRANSRLASAGTGVWVASTGNLRRRK